MILIGSVAALPAAEGLRRSCRRKPEGEFPGDRVPTRGIELPPEKRMLIKSARIETAAVGTECGGLLEM